MSKNDIFSSDFDEYLIKSPIRNPFEDSSMDEGIDAELKKSKPKKRTKKYTEKEIDKTIKSLPDKRKKVRKPRTAKTKPKLVINKTPEVNIPKKTKKKKPQLSISEKPVNFSRKNSSQSSQITSEDEAIIPLSPLVPQPKKSFKEKANKLKQKVKPHRKTVKKIINQRKNTNKKLIKKVVKKAQKGYKVQLGLYNNPEVKTVVKKRVVKKPPPPKIRVSAKQNPLINKPPPPKKAKSPPPPKKIRISAKKNPLIYKPPSSPSKKNIFVDKLALDSLKPNELVDDTAVEMYLNLINPSPNNIIIPPSLCKSLNYTKFNPLLLVECLLEKNILSCNYVFFPICKSKHWILITINIKERKIIIYTSLGSAKIYKLQAANVKNVLESLSILDKFEIEYDEQPKQQNLVDCGIYIIEKAKNIMENKNSKQQIKPLEIRKRITNSLQKYFKPKVKDTDSDSDVVIISPPSSNFDPILFQGLIEQANINHFKNIKGSLDDQDMRVYLYLLKEQGSKMKNTLLLYPESFKYIYNTNDKTPKNIKQEYLEEIVNRNMSEKERFEKAMSLNNYEKFNNYDKVLLPAGFEGHWFLIVINNKNKRIEY